MDESIRLKEDEDMSDDCKRKWFIEYSPEMRQALKAQNRVFQEYANGMSQADYYRLTEEGFKKLQEALDKPYEPTPELRALFNEKEPMNRYTPSDDTDADFYTVGDITICTVEDWEREEFRIGVAIRHPDDAPNQTEGRHVAWWRAMTPNTVAGTAGRTRYSNVWHFDTECYDTLAEQIQGVEDVVKLAKRMPAKFRADFVRVALGMKL